ncbi:MAG: hypothetical protein ABUL64_00730, partial [Singulisphaera sp.]
MFTRSLRVAFVTVSLFVPALVSAQEELPAPSSPPPRGPLRRPLTDQDRVQRRERLLNLGGQVLNALVPTDPNAPGAIPAIDMERLNGALGPLATALLGGGRDIESLRIGFDPQATNFAEDRLRLNFDAKLRRTAWADAPSRAVGGISARVSQSDSGGLVAMLDGRMRMQTPT